MKPKNIVTFIIGAALGSLTTWLFTSKKGAEVRKSIHDEFNTLIKKSKESQGSEQGKTEFK